MLEWNDPLSIDIRTQALSVLNALPSQSRFASVLHGLEANDSCLTTISKLLLEPSLTLIIKTAFQPLLVDLCARWLDDTDQIVKKAEALAFLVEVHEEIASIAMEFFRQPAMNGGLLTFACSASNVDLLPPLHLHKILLAYYRVLCACPMLPDYLMWDLTPLLRLIHSPHPDRGVRWLAIRCYALQTGMGEANREKLELRVLGELGADDCPIAYGEDIHEEVQMTDGWILPVTEVKRIQRWREEMLRTSVMFCSEDSISARLLHSQLSPRIANVHGVFLLKVPTSYQPTTDLVQTASAVDTLRRLALRLSLRLPTLLTSTPSSGKSALIRHLAAQIYPRSQNHVVTINLADTSMDPRSLLGSYISSSKQSGAFEWKDGVLVQAMRAGKWVVLKDVDRGSNEALGILAPLIESLAPNKRIGVRARVTVPGRGDVEAADEFMLFATRSVEGGDKMAYIPPSFFTALKWAEVVATLPTALELKEIVETKLPLLTGAISDRLIDIWQAVRRLRTVSATRSIGIRDLEKFCRRVASLLGSYNVSIRGRTDSVGSDSLATLIPNPSLREDIFLEARDVFFASGSPTKAAQMQQDAIRRLVGEHLGISDETQEWVLHRRAPEFDMEKDVDGRLVAVKAGRTRLLADTTTGLMDPSNSMKFSLHKPAMKLISQLATCIAAAEPVLLTGETGTGKTTMVTYLASLLNRPLLSLNLSNQTESSDLIGGFRPVNARIPALDLQNRFTELFKKTFSKKRNESFEGSLRKAINDGKWKTAVKLWSSAAKMAMDKIKERATDEGQRPQLMTSADPDADAPRKRQKTRHSELSVTEADWLAFDKNIREFDLQHVRNGGKFAFQFVEGPLVNAIRSGSWVLLDEINLASPETLECVSSLLQSTTSSVTLTEQGSLEPVPRHAKFRIFACMNPATDVGKKDLPANIRSRFTEIDVPPPDRDRDTLLNIITHYIGNIAIGDKGVILDVSQFYTGIKDLSEAGQIADGCNHQPHYNMRTLSRALTFAKDVVQQFGLRRSLWEGFTMAFTMVLNKDSESSVFDLARRTLLSTVKNHTAFLTQSASAARVPNQDVLPFGPFALLRGPKEEDSASDYVLSPSVQKKLVDLARIILTGRFPVLIQGPTSSGKTSAVNYLARRTGHRMVRINNHEHTDIQEYLGSYVTDPQTGRLVYQDGLLVQALRRGDWIVLDELNLAPTDVLEALNRLLDDNRELVIPETHEVIKPHPHFMLFATQNPPGAYGGRKVLSRALRSRFLEVHFDDVPQAELEYILSQRSRIAPSYSQKIVTVFSELQKRRQVSRIFEGKQGFATLRDLFRWAGRDAVSYQELAENGYVLLAERARREEDRAVVKEIIEKTMNVTIMEDKLYDMTPLIESGEVVLKDSSIVWTKPMQRLFMLVSRALKCNEPVLLVGETGTGKTSVCQVYADIVGRQLKTVNCHQNLEAADIIGGQRPTRRKQASSHELLAEAADILAGITDRHPMSVEDLREATMALRQSPTIDAIKLKRLLVIERTLSEPKAGLLEWQDGALLKCMRDGDIFLLDEISLADDSVLERLNSVLEPSRAIVLAERGGQKIEEHEVIAASGFQFISTMNPGGDFGKKELSPALRNRLTEIWVPSIMSRHDLDQIINHSWHRRELSELTKPILDFIDWICAQVDDSTIVTVRDILGWVHFCNVVYDGCNKSASFVFGHGARMSILDGLSSLSQLSSWNADALKDLTERAIVCLQELMPGVSAKVANTSWEVTHDSLRIGEFSIQSIPSVQRASMFSLSAPTALDNATRVLRACQIARPILLEGSPGVGKTSLVVAIASAAGQRLRRINFSEQTDIIDLFGSDLPVEGGHAGQFMWRDAEFLHALQTGEWVLLDEMNLAPQAILEGLNAVFDHRGMVYIPELDRSFVRHPNFRVFAAQNPLQQGSGRKGLPKSFLNRFTKVYIQPMTPEDLLLVCKHIFHELPSTTLQQMISFNSRLSKLVTEEQIFGRQGAPWEFNLRDVMRWSTLLQRAIEHDGDEGPNRLVDVVYTCRFRNIDDKRHLRKTFEDIFGLGSLSFDQPLRCSLSPQLVSCGVSTVPRGNGSRQTFASVLVQENMSSMEAALTCISHNWLLILTGARCVGKTNFVRNLAQVVGQPLREVTLHSASDTSDLIGSYEQIDEAQSTKAGISALVDVVLRNYIATADAAPDVVLAVRALQQHVKDAKRGSPLDRTTLKQLCEQIYLYIREGDEVKAVLKTLIKSFSSDGSSLTQFHWADGPLVEAMKAGNWLLLNDVNQCSAAVLDRLNSLCEPGGQLILSEKGNDQAPVIPHSNFKLLMAYDPSTGEISRAMRNRGIEIAVTSCTSSGSLEQAHRLPFGLRYTNVTAPVEQASFEESRRVLARSLRITGDAHTSSDAASILEDATSARLCDVLTTVNNNKHASNNAALLFLYRFSTPNHPHQLCRLLRQSMPEYCVIPRLTLTLKRFGTTLLLDSIRNKYERASNLFTTLLGCQAFDFHLTTNVYPKGENVDSEILRLTTEAFILLSLLDEGFVGTRESLGGGDPFLDSATSMLTELGGATAEALRQSVDFEDLSVGLDFLNMAEFLSFTVKSRTFNFTIAHIVTAWMMRKLQDASPSFAKALVPLTAFSRTVALTTGRGVTSMWKTVFRENRIQSKHGIIDRILVAAERAALGGQLEKSNSLQQRLLEIISLCSMSAGKMADTDFDDILNQLCNDQNGSVDHSVDELSLMLPEQPLLVAELSHLSMLHLFSCGTNGNSLHRLVLLACTNLRGHTSRMASYRCLLWAIEANKGSAVPLPDLMRSHIEWLNAIWRTKTPPEKETADPSFLLAPTFLKSSCDIDQWPTITLDRFQQFSVGLKSQTEIMFATCRQQRRLHEILSLLVQNVIMFCISLPGHFDEVEIVSVTTMHPNVRCSVEGMQDLIKLLAGCRDEHTLLLLNAELIPTLKTAVTCLGGNMQDCIGRCWIALSDVIMTSYIPDVPMDPSIALWCDYHYWERRHSMVISQISLHTTMEQLLSGKSMNATIMRLQEELQLINVNLQSSQHLSVDERVSLDPSRLRLWDEVRQFRLEAINHDKITSLLNSLRSRETAGTLREEMLQSSISNFMQRAQSVYSNSEDLYITIELALLQLKFGMKLVALAAGASPTQLANDSTIQALVKYPTGSFLKDVPISSLLAHADNEFTQSDAIIMHMRGLAVIVSWTGSKEAVREKLHSSYEALVAFWQSDRAKAAIEEKNSQSLYRNSADDEDAADFEEIAIRKMFPTYDSVDEDESTSADQLNRQAVLLSPQNGQELLSTHLQIFQSSSPSASLSRLTWHRRRCVKAWMRNDFWTSSDLADTSSFPFRARMIHDVNKELDQLVSGYNFYLDPNVPELKRLLPIVGSMRQQLRQLIVIWPEQTVLQHLVEHCDKLFSIYLNSPVAKALTAVEQLLQHTDDWEMYASRDNSLQKHRQSLTMLIVDWRKLELSGWRELLNSEADLAASSLWEWWFRLYEILVQESHRMDDSSDNCEEDVLDLYLNRLDALLEDFLRSAPLGQFQQRIILLRSFRLLIESNSQTKLSTTTLRVVAIIHSLEIYYGRFINRAMSSLSEQRASLEKDIRAFIKLASWRDINVHSLRQSAKHSHRQLYRKTRKFREILRQPVTPFISESASYKDNDDSTTINIDHTAHILPTSTHSGATPFLQKFSAILTRFAERSWRNSSATSINVLSKTIVTTSEELAGSPIPNNLDTSKLKKWHASRMLRKRRAWNDLLKELKRQGVAPNVKPDVLAQQSNRRWLMETRNAGVCSKGILDSLAKQIDTYFYRTVDVLSELRSGMASHHDDITTRELNRGVMLIESLFHVAIRCRRKLTGLLDPISELSALKGRLQMIIFGTSPCIGGDETARSCALVKDLTGYMIGVLDELLADLVEVVKDRQQPLQNPGDTEATLRMHLELYRGSMSRLTDIVSNIYVSNPAIVLEDELQFVVQVISQFRGTANFLQSIQAKEHVFGPFCNGVNEFLLREIDKLPLLKGIYGTGECSSKEVIDTLLVIAQKVDLQPGIPDPDEDDEGHIRIHCAHYSAISKILKVDDVVVQVQSLMSQLPHSTPASAKVALSSVLPMLDEYARYADNFSACVATWNRAVLKLAFIVSSITRRISKEGFCRPAEGEDKASGEGEMEAAEGDGFGEGTGQQDITEQIENEGQVEGLRGDDQKEEDNPERENKDDGLEVDADMFGDMEGFVDEGAEQDENPDDSEDGPSPSDLDDEMDKYDGENIDTVDENFWGTKDDEQTERYEEKAGKQSDESEMAAKEEAERSKGEEHLNTDERNETEGENERQEDEGKAPDDVQVEDAGIEAKDERSLDSADKLSEEQAEENGDLLEDDAEMNDNTSEADAEANEVENMQVDEQPDGVDDAVAEDINEAMEEDAFEQSENEQSSGAAKESDVTEGGDPSADAAADSKGDTKQAQGEPGSSAADTLGDPLATEKRDAVPEDSEPSTNPTQPNAPTNANATRASDRNNSGTSNFLDYDPIPNPLRNLGDALKEIRRRVQEIQTPDTNAPPAPKTTDDGDAGAPLEYAQEMEDIDMQALGPAGDEEIERLGKLNLEELNDEKSRDAKADPDMEMRDVPQFLDRAEVDLVPPKRAEKDKQDFEEEDTKNASIQSRDRKLGEDDDAEMSHAGKPLGERAVTPTPEIEDNVVEAALIHWRSEGQPSASAHHIWRLYESLTHHLSFSLCEQLRLILEPTKATRLQGDFRTGKRLNMKKIIPYIASDYTKDKIWLRRTRPSQREYQVLIALDDSRSMAESHAVHLALETLALVSKALNRLEVGDVAVARFGAQAEIIHDFTDGPFSDAAGAKVVNAFKFDQNATDVLGLLNTSVRMLGEARDRRGGGASAELWQLMIIISDGVCQEHEKLRATLRRAAEQRVLVVFVVIDAHGATSGLADSKQKSKVDNSIINMTQASYKTVNGRTELHMQRYLDSFPFEFFAILKSVETLPEVLSDTLKQFFERVVGDTRFN